MMTLPQAVLDRRVFNQAIYDLHSTQYMLSQTARYISKDRNVVDVGAAVGLYSHFWAPLCKHIYSYEAVSEVFDQLEKVKAQHENMTIYNKAVSNFCGTTKFYVDDKRLSNNSFSDLVGGQEIEVPVTKLDKEDIDNVGFIKIDVEGHELKVLQGAENMINIDKPVVMCEIYPKFNDGPVENTFNFFFDRGYTCYFNVKQQGLIEVLNTEEGARIARDEKLIKVHDCDFLFVWYD